jgi:RND superfamily putative drug exporter
MLSRLGRFTVRRRKAVLVGAAIAFAVAGGWGGGVAEHLSSGGFDDPASESFKADQALLDTFGTGTPNLLLLVTAEGGSVDDPAVVAAGTALTQELAAEPHLTNVVSYWTLGSPPPLRSDGGDRALVLARIEGTQDEVNDLVTDLSPDYRRADGLITVEPGGFAEVFREVGTTIEEDLVRAEAIALPITLILLLLVFGSVVSASLPLAIGGLSIVGAMAVLRLLSTVTEVSIFSLNLTTARGLGLAIDYALFVVSRYREELRAGHEPGIAVQRTVRTAGRTVAFSAVTVAASLCALLVFPFSFLRSFAYAGVAVAFLAGFFSIVVLPAILAALGTRVDKLTIFKRSTESHTDDGFWHRMAITVMRRPVVFAATSIAVLLLLGAPFLGINLSLPDDRVLPEEAASRQVHDVLREEFSSGEPGTSSVVAQGIGDPNARLAEVDAYAATLAQLPGVSRVDALTGTYCGEGLAELGCTPGQQVLPGGAGRYLAFSSANAGGSTYLAVVPSIEPLSPEGEDLVEAIRAADAPFPTEVTGMSAELVDSKAALFSRLPLAAGIIALVTFVVLFLQFGSVVIPLKAVVLNLLSLSATFGAMVWVFQDGHLSGALDFDAIGSIDATTPILMFCVAFGLSMDYEVFLLSRIKEEYDRTGDNELSVARGLERTGRIVTAAALLIAVVFIAFATSHVTFIKLFGVGLTLAVLMDAFLIRGTLVPAFMRLAGGWNWWAPAPLRRLHDRIGFSEHVDLDAPDPAVGDSQPVPASDTTIGARVHNGSLHARPTDNRPAGRPRRTRPLVAAKVSDTDPDGS